MCKLSGKAYGPISSAFNSNDLFLVKNKIDEIQTVKNQANSSIIIKESPRSLSFTGIQSTYNGGKALI